MQARTLPRTMASLAPEVKRAPAGRQWPIRASLLFVLIASGLLWGGLILIFRVLMAFFASGL